MHVQGKNKLLKQKCCRKNEYGPTIDALERVAINATHCFPVFFRNRVTHYSKNLKNNILIYYKITVKCFSKMNASPAKTSLATVK